MHSSDQTCQSRTSPSGNSHPSPRLRIHPGRLALILLGCCLILAALLFPMAHTTPMDVIPGQRDTKVSLPGGGTITQTFSTSSPFSQISVAPSALRTAKDLTLEMTLQQGDSTISAAAFPLSRVKANARLKMDVPLQRPGTYQLVLSAAGTGEVKFTGSDEGGTLSLGIRLVTRTMLYGTFPLYLGALLLLISCTPLHGQNVLRTKRSALRFPRPRWLCMRLCLAGIFPAMIFAQHPEWLGITWEYANLVDGDLTAPVSLMGLTLHGPLLTAMLATWCTLVLSGFALMEQPLPLPRIVLILILGSGIVMGLCRPLLFEVGFDEGQHRQIVDQFAGNNPFTLPEALYFSSSWNLGLIFHMMGGWLQGLMGLSAPWGYRLGNLCSLLVYGAMAYQAVKIMPRHQVSMALLALWPTHVFLAVTTTYDSLLIGGMLLGTGMLFRELSTREQKLSPGTAMGMLTLLALCTLAKSAYCPVILMLLLLPKDKFPSSKQAVLFRSFVVMIALVCTLGRVVETTITISSGGTPDDIPLNLTAAQSRDIMISGDERMDGTSSSGQLALIRNSPGTFLGAMGHMIFLMFPRQATEMAATYGYFGHDPLSLWLLILLLAAGPLLEQGKSSLSLRRRLAMMGIGLLPLVILGITMYMVSTALGSPVVVGMQPRYLLPVFPLVALALSHPLRPSGAIALWARTATIGLAGILLVIQGWIHLFLPFYT